MRQALYVGLSILLGTAVFGLVLFLSDSSPHEVLVSVATAGWPALVALLGVILLQLLLQAISWRILLGSRQPLLPYFAAILVGWSMNFLTPSMYLGGEPLRAMYLASRTGETRRRVLASVLVHKYLELASFLFFLCLSTVFFLLEYGSDLSVWVVRAVLLADGLLVAGGVGLYLSVFYRWGFLVRLTDGLARLGIASRWLRKHRPKILEVEVLVHRAFRRDFGRTLLSLAVMTLFTLLIFLRPVAFFAFLKGGWPFSFADLALLFVLIQLLQALQFTPGGLGILEGGLPGVFLVIGVSPVPALAYTTITRIADISVVGLGFSVFAHYGLAGLVKTSEEDHADPPRDP